jgi:hypothetical protein
MDDLPFDWRHFEGDGRMTARILCLIILLLEICGLSLSITDRKWMILIFYTQLSNLVTTVSALLLLIIGQPYFVTVLRYLSTCMLVMTFLVTACVLIPMGGNPKKLLWSGNGLYHHCSGQSFCNACGLNTKTSHTSNGNCSLKAQ